MGRRNRQQQPRPNSPVPPSMVDKKDSFLFQIKLILITGLVSVIGALIVYHLTKSPEPASKRSGNVTNPVTIIQSAVPLSKDTKPELLINYNGKASVGSVDMVAESFSDSIGLWFYTKNVGSSSAKHIVTQIAMIFPTFDFRNVDKIESENPSFKIRSGSTFTCLKYVPFEKTDTAIIYLRMRYKDSLNNNFISEPCFLYYTPGSFDNDLAEMPTEYYQRVKKILTKKHLW